MNASRVLRALLPACALLALSQSARPAEAVAVVTGSEREFGGHGYCLLTLSNWPDAEAFAESLGGHLVVIDDASENQWVWDTYSALKTADFLWIGLFQPDGSAEPDGGWQWVDGSALTFTAWKAGEPNNAGDEKYAHLQGGAVWNDAGLTYYGTIQGVVEFGSGPGEEEVTEAWRSPYGAGRSVAVNPADGSAWAAMGAGVMHVSAGGVILDQINSFIGPYAVSVNPTDGSCWVADVGAGEVVHLSSEGEELWRGDEFMQPASVAVNPADGSCWVADRGTYDEGIGWYLGGAVIHLSAGGAVLWQSTDYFSPQSVSVNPTDGSCWIADATGAFISHVSTGGSELWWGGDFYEPGAVAVDGSDGSCWVGDRGYYNSDTQTVTGGCVAHLDSSGSESWRGGLVSGGSVAADRTDGSCWAGDMANDVLVHLSASGAELWRNTDEAGPSGEAVNTADGSCWVTTYYSGKLLHFAATGAQLWQGQGFAYPMSVSADSHDNSCWVGDGGAVVHVAANGDELWRSGLVCCAWSVAADSGDGSCWAVDPGYDRALPAPELVHFSAAGVELGRVAEFSLLSVISANPTDGSCWVADGDGVAHVSAAGSVLWSGAAFSQATIVSANAADGSCWVVDHGASQVVHLGSHGTELWRGGAGATPLVVSVNAADGSFWEIDGDEVPQVAHVSAAGDVLWSGTNELPLWWVSANQSDGSCWVADEFDVIHLSPEGHRQWIGNHFYDPWEISANSADGSCWVADTENRQVVHLVLAPPVMPTAAFTAAPTTGTAPLTVAFTDQSTGNPSAWTWIFGDGDTSVLRNPSHTYLSAGSYTVKLTVSRGSLSNSLTKRNYIVVTPPAPPVAAFSASPTSGTAPLTVHFTDASTNGPTAWTWNFGDGGASAEQNPTHGYEQAGRYTVSLTATNAGGSDTETKTAFITARFADVAADFWAYDHVMACVDAGVVAGYPDGAYHPELVVTRGQMAVFIARAIAGGDEGVQVPTGTASPSFSDVPADYWAYPYIEYCAQSGIVVGYWDSAYHPEEVVNRGQMAVYIARAVATPTGDAGVPEVPAGATPTFSDVTADSDWAWCYRYVEYCSAADIVQGYWDGTYHPEREVTRDQMAVYVARAFGLPL